MAVPPDVEVGKPGGIRGKVLPVLRVVSAYFIFSVAWIFLSDRFLIGFTSDPNALSWFQTYKGILFVVVSTALIYILLRRELSKQEEVWRSYERESGRFVYELKQKQAELEQAYDATIEGWASALEMRSQEVEAHSRRVVDASLKLGRVMGLSDEELGHLRRGALLHDIGKMRIPDSILLKDGPLTEEERKVIEQHPHWGGEMLAPIAFLQPAMAVPRFHHEKWDGSGYPYHLKGEEIPLLARIFSVVDVWDALSTERSYHEARNQQEVRDYLLAEAGKSFDPNIVRVFLEQDWV